MFCRKCGYRLPEGAVFCPKCGCRVNDTPSAENMVGKDELASEQANPDNSNISTGNNRSGISEEIPESVSGKKKAPKRKTAAIIGIALLLATVLLCLGALYLLKPEVGETSEWRADNESQLETADASGETLPDYQESQSAIQEEEMEGQATENEISEESGDEAESPVLSPVFLKNGWTSYTADGEKSGLQLKFFRNSSGEVEIDGYLNNSEYLSGTVSVENDGSLSGELDVEKQYNESTGYWESVLSKNRKYRFSGELYGEDNTTIECELTKTGDGSSLTFHLSPITGEDIIAIFKNGLSEGLFSALYCFTGDPKEIYLFEEDEYRYPFILKYSQASTWQIYYGNYTENGREGNGIHVGTNNSGDGHIYCGNWVNDRPEGYGIYAEKGGPTEIIWTGNFINGVFSDTFTAQVLAGDIAIDWDVANLQYQTDETFLCSEIYLDADGFAEPLPKEYVDQLFGADEFSYFDSNGDYYFSRDENDCISFYCVSRTKGRMVTQYGRRHYAIPGFG